MEEANINTKTVQIATQVIMLAGNARMHIKNAIKQFSEGNYPEVEKLLSKAENDISNAHIVQTEVIQAEARGDKLEISLLLTHAQDTLMSASTELQMTNNFLELLKPIMSK